MIMTAIILQLTPSFSTTSYIMIEPGNTEIVDAVSAVMVGGSADLETVEGEVRVLKSRMLADRVVMQLQLDKDPEFNSSLTSPGLLDRFLAQVRGAFGWAVSTVLQSGGWTDGEDAGPQLRPLAEGLHAEPVGAQSAAIGVKEWIKETLGGAKEEVTSDADRLAATRTRIVDRFLSHLSVSVDGLSRVIAVTFNSENPKTAANAANTLADLYIVSKLERKFEAAKTANRWINERINELRDQVETAEDAVEQYRAQYDLIASNDVKLSTQEATELSAQLALARAQRAEAEARLRELEFAVAGPEFISEVLKSGTVAQLRMQEAEVKRKVADLVQYLGPNHPNLIRARAELDQIQSQIRIEVQKVASALSNDLVAAKAREGSLSDSLDKLKGEAGAQNQVEVKLRALQREATASWTMLETFLLRAQETSSQETFQSADAHIVSRADVPQSPTFPQKRTLLLASMLGSLTIGVLLAFLVEMMS